MNDQNNDNQIYEIIFHGRGGMGAVTAAEMLCDIAYKDGFHDVLSVPIIGAERRGAPIRVFVKLSPKREIKSIAAVEHADVTLIFDTSLLPLPGVGENITKGIVIVNTNEELDLSQFKEGVKVYTIDATGISLSKKLLVSGSPVLNVPILGAFAKVTGYITLESMNKVLIERFGEKKAELNMKSAKEAFDNVKALN